MTDETRRFEAAFRETLGTAEAVCRWASEERGHLGAPPLHPSPN
jgi:hypothetical protein